MAHGFGPLVDTAWLAAQLDAPDLRILDCSVSLVPHEGRVRPESGLAAWREGHIPGSAFADLIGDLSDPAAVLPLTMPSAERFAAAMGRLGVANDSRVVLYDTSSHSWATRLWWMLRAVGFDRAGVLDGGLAKWRAEGRPLSTAPAHHAATTFVARPRDGAFVGRDGVLAALGEPRTRIINALSADEHAGRVTRTARPGRIPGSGNVPAGGLVEPPPGGYRSLEDLRSRFADAGALDADRVIFYCGGGIAATSDAFTLLRLGARDVAVYDGSLAEWSADPTLPLETG